MLSMESIFTSSLISIALFLLLSPSFAVDSIAANQVIKDGETIVSAGDMYEMGFFSPPNSNNRYMGIWFKKTATGTVVWVANRDLPISNTSGTFKVSSEGLLLLSCCGDTLIWSSTSSPFVRYINPMAQLLDTGNFVVKDGNTNFVWQSFDYPGDTWLPGMKFGKDFVTGINRNLTSWKSPNDPSLGEYVNYVDTNGYPQIFTSQGLVVRLRVGPWNGVRFSGLPDEIPNPIYSIDYAVNQKEIYYKYDILKNSSVVQMVHLKWDGTIEMMYWNNRSHDWLVYATGPVDTCGRYGICGPYGTCDINKNPPCSCIDGFEPKLPDEWSMADWSTGCQLKTPLDCQAPQVFWKIKGMKFPDTRQSWYNESMTLGECEIACRKNCSCTAYANLYVMGGGSGCLLWFGALMDLKVCGESQYLYIRMPASLLTDEVLTISQSGFNKKIRVLTITLSISLVLLGMFLAAYACNKKKKRSSTKGRGRRVHAFDKRDSNVVKEDLELNFISLSIIVKATNNFSIDNKLGEGGFGPVYKGVLESGQEIAVKKLSETSEQGYDEFYNEVVCVARLQHRNLVKLLGYCMDGNERMLIYEYLSNKSLDLHLFDETKSSMLEWSLRFDIIRGVAKGILYLHQDSRHRIIHRDLKASNILLDHNMNPKISDFGLAREFGGDQITAKTKKVVGTFGYISPEYAIHGRFSVKSDVFSFGVLVLEMVSGKKNQEFFHEDVNDNLLGHAWRLYTKNKCLELMCPSLRDSCVVSEAKRTIHVGLLCVQNLAQDRPTMSYVVRMLSGAGALPPPKQPAFFVGEDLPNPSPFSRGVDEATITTLEP